MSWARNLLLRWPATCLFCLFNLQSGSPRCIGRILVYRCHGFTLEARCLLYTVFPTSAHLKSDPPIGQTTVRTAAMRLNCQVARHGHKA